MPAFARELLRRATDARAAPVDRYVRLVIARDLATRAGDASLALESVARLADIFDVDHLKEKVETLVRVSDGAEAEEQAGTLATAAVLIAEEAIAADRFDEAAPLAAVMRQAGVRSGGLIVWLRANEQADRLGFLLAEWRFARPALEKLKAGADDPGANLIAGRFYCKAKGNWERGLPALARSSDEGLKRVAGIELAGARSASERLALGDAWWDLANAPLGAARNWMRDRAAKRYVAALPGLAGPERIRAAEYLRLARAPPSLRAPPAPGAAPVPSGTVGGRGGGAFQDVPKVSALLAGFCLTCSNFGGNRILKSVQPIYRGPSGTSKGGVYGGRGCGAWEIVARPGYAVGAIRAKGGDRVDGFRIVFMRATSKGLDPNDSYESGWIGGTGGGAERLLAGDGSFVVGIHGRRGADLDCFGLLLMP
ncbi:MAG: hypothetical protein ACYS9X_21375 [Planctomycetota bacterium]